MDIIYKLPVLLVLGFILFSLFQGMYYMAKDDGKNNSTRVVRALTLRVVLSLLLFILLMAGYFFGLLQPHSLLPQ
ncbi:MAG: twin transmembrane helix small protein [Candidatus Thiodiazotropha sp.]